MNTDKEIIDKLFDAWFHSKHKLIEFDASFPDDKESEELKEELLPDFCDTLIEFYWNHFFITIAKLLDPYTQGQNKNLSLFTLSDLLKKSDKIEWENVLKKTEELKTKFLPVIKYRRKNLAHFDFDYTIGNTEFGTSTHIDEINYFFDKMLELINLTYEPLGFDIRVPAIIGRVGFKGGNEFNRILSEYKKYYAQQSI
nr:hypothetical protein [uncultured Psychroserpens sp.]